MPNIDSFQPGSGLPSQGSTRREDERRERANAPAVDPGSDVTIPGGAGGEGFRSDLENARLQERNLRLIGESAAALPDNSLIFNIWEMIQDEAFEQARIMDWGEAMFNNVITTSFGTVTTWIGDYLNNQRRLGVAANTYYNSPQGFQELFDVAWNRFATINKDFSATTGATFSSGSGSGRGLSAADIRNSFDLQALAQQATQIWRNMLYTAPPNANALASAFVESVVATNAEKKIDFTAFVRSRAMATGRFKTIFVDKPDGISPEDYLRRFTGTAELVLRPDNVESAAIGGARLGSDQATFQARLARSNEVVTSAPFINSLETRVQNLSEVLRG